MSLAISAAARVVPLALGTYASQRFTILIFHRVLPQFDPMRPDEPTVVQFDWQMQTLARHFSPLSLQEALSRAQAQTLPERAVCVTFDDGYADNAQCALPILQRHGVPASVFVSTAYLNGGRMWNDSVREALRIAPEGQLDLSDIGLERFQLSGMDERRVAAEKIITAIKHRDPAERARLVAHIEHCVGDLPDDLMLTTAQLRRLVEGGIEIGAHTVSHPILASVSLPEAEAEIAGSKNALEEMLQRAVTQFAYPNGAPDKDYTHEHRDMVQRLGFEAAVSTHWGAACVESDPFQLPRFTPWDRQPLKYALRLLTNYRRRDPLLDRQ